jgi:hypothetical protein
VREGRVGRLIINVPPRHLKSNLASVAFPAWCLGHDPSMQILCVSYAQDLAEIHRDRPQIPLPIPLLGRLCARQPTGGQEGMGDKPPLAL